MIVREAGRKKEIAIRRGGDTLHETSMWNPATQRQHSRPSLRYQTDLTDAEGAIPHPFLPAKAYCGRKRAWPMRETINGYSQLDERRTPIARRAPWRHTAAATPVTLVTCAECGISGGSVMVGRQAVVAELEVVGDPAVGGEETLGVAARQSR